MRASRTIAAPPDRRGAEEPGHEREAIPHVELSEKKGRPTRARRHHREKARFRARAPATRRDAARAKAEELTLALDEQVKERRVSYGGYLLAVKRADPYATRHL